jgi:hypothetical protein
MKGLNSLEKALIMYTKWSSFSKPVAIELDCTHFDKHINYTLLQYEFGVYLKHYKGKDRDELFDLLRHQLNVDWDVFTRDGFRVAYKTSGGRVSGSVNTALGNIVVMTMCFHLYGKRLHDRDIKFEYVNEGDDCFFIIEQGDYDRIPDIVTFFLQFGLQVRIENVVTSFNKIQFCQTSPICIDGVWRLIRMPKAVFFKDLTQLYWKGVPTFHKWLNEVGIGGAILNRKVPVLQNLYRRMRNDVGAKVKFAPSLENEMFHSGLKVLTRGMVDDSFCPCSPEDRYQFYLTTGIHPDVQIELEQIIDNLPQGFIGPGEIDSLVNTFPSTFSTLLNDQSK